MSSVRKLSSTATQNQAILDDSCSFNEVLKLLSPRWKMQVLYCITEGINRFSLIKEEHPTLSDQVLGKRLKELEAEGFLSKQVDHDAVPVAITYSLTDKAQELILIIPQLCQWNEKWTGVKAC